MSETKTSRHPIKKVENAVVFSDGTILLKNVRASYPHVFEPVENKADDGTVTSAYSCQVLMPKATHRAAKDVCVAAIAELLKEAKVAKIPADRKFIRDGDLLAKDETEGQWVISARERNRPSVRHIKRDPETGKPRRLDPDFDKDTIYGGCYINILIRPWWQSNKYGKRVNAGLAGVQFLRDGEPFGQGRIREEDIDQTFDSEEDETGGWEDDTDGL